MNTPTTQDRLFLSAYQFARDRLRYFPGTKTEDHMYEPYRTKYLDEGLRSLEVFDAGAIAAKPPTHTEDQPWIRQV